MDIPDYLERVFFTRFVELTTAGELEMILDYSITFDQLPDEFGKEELPADATLEVRRVYEPIASVILRSSVARALELLETYPDARIYELTPVHATEEG